MREYNPQKIEAKWRKEWEKKKAWKVDLKKAKNPYYNLMMFPYPSAEGLHVGNVYAFTGSDIFGRFKRMQRKDVFEPMGFDAFGIHSENFAIKKGVHPKIQTEKNVQNFRKQLKQMGALFAWDREVDTTKPEYYKWTQWLFLELYKAGLAYRAKAPVDWCPSCKTVLADEQVAAGRCERCGTEVVQKEMEQWFLRITKYADRLLKNLETIEWSERTRMAQKNWIGKSQGAELEFPVADSDLKIGVFTTRPDTLFGATYMVLAPEHQLLEKLKARITNWDEVQKYREEAKKKSELERTELAKEKTGIELKGIKAINPASKEEIPVFIADYALASYGTGAIMAVPAHDQRDFAFAKKYSLPITIVICPHYPEKTCPLLDKAYTGEGHLVGSGQFDGLASQEARAQIMKFAGGKFSAKYHLRDWLISRQRYWGPPIPIIYCAKCGTVPVPEKDLPVKLPFVKDFRPQGTGKSPLASVASFVKTKCPQCKGLAERETDVSDTFLDSAWYFFRYPCTEFKDKPFDKERIVKWLPVDMYIGGQEHAVLHLLYTRFITMALKDLGYLEFEEPFKKFRAHGLITKDGAKMSKSKGNVVNPDEYFKNYGVDTVRMYLMFVGPFSEGGDWSDKGIVGISRFLNRVFSFAMNAKDGKSEHEALKQKTIKKVSEDLESLRYNTAISALMEYVNAFSQKDAVAKEDAETLLILLAPFAPHLAEELWHEIGRKDSVHDQPWPSYDSKFLQEEKIRLIIQVNGKMRSILDVLPDASEEAVRVEALKNEKIRQWIGQNPIRKTIFVKGKILNFVV